MPENIVIKKADIYDWEPVVNLAWRTFLRFEAEEYGKEGTKSFQDFLEAPMLQRMFLLGDYVVFAAMDGEKHVGVISLRNRKHISLLFVDEKYHKNGIGRMLIEQVQSFVKAEYGENSITVNAAPYALGFYHKLGFVDVAPQLESEGILYTPMEKLI